MRIAFFATLPVCLGVLSAAEAPSDAVRMLARAPLRFEPAPGDSGSFVARGLRFRFSFDRNGAVLHAGENTVHLTFEGASAGARIEGLDRLGSNTSIIRGNDPAAWRTAIPNYGRLQVRDLYPGVDLVYYGNRSELEYDLLVKAGSDPRQLRLRFKGGHPHLDRDGNLAGGFLQKHPAAYQVAANGTRVPVASRYRKNNDGTFGFILGPYDKTRELVIDPVLTMSAYFGGSGQDYASAIGHDTLGFIYVAGTTESSDLSGNGSPAQGAFGSAAISNIFIAKLDPHVPPANQLVFLTYLGGTGTDTLNDMAVTPAGQVYLTGQTTSVDFPNVNGEATALNGTSDVFVMWLDLTQNQATVNYSTYLGGSGDDLGSGVAFDSQGKIYIAGTTRSGDFPIINGFQSVNGSPQTAFVAVLDPTQSGAGTLTYSSYLGGAYGESGRGIAVAKDGTVWMVGGTYSADFPVANGPFQANYNPGGDAFVAQFDPTQSGNASLLYATYLGGSGPDEAEKVVIDAAGRIIVAGYTGSPDFPITLATALQFLYGGNFDAFVTILNPKNTSSQLVYSTYYGGSQADIPYDLKIDSSGNLYLTGLTMSPDFPVTGNALQPTYNFFTLDGFMLEFTPARVSLGGLVYSSFISSDGTQSGFGVDFDVKGNIYSTGYTSGPLFDPFGGAPKSTSGGNTDAFLMGVNPTGTAPSQ